MKKYSFLQEISNKKILKTVIKHGRKSDDQLGDKMEKMGRVLQKMTNETRKNNRPILKTWRKIPYGISLKNLGSRSISKGSEIVGKVIGNEDLVDLAKENPKAVKKAIAIGALPILPALASPIPGSIETATWASTKYAIPAAARALKKN